MKKAPLYALTLSLGVAFGILIGLLFTKVLFPEDDASTDPKVYGVEEGASAAHETLVGMALETAGYIKSGDYRTLSKMVDPRYGVVFSPFAEIGDFAKRVSFTAAEVADFASNTEVYTWGTQVDGGEPISLTVTDYMKEYVADQDYTAASIIGVNFTVRVGNVREDVTEKFASGQFVDLCVPGTEEGGFQDWSILRLVFEEYNGQLWLTAIIHSENTV